MPTWQGGSVEVKLAQRFHAGVGEFWRVVGAGQVW
jgi:hypothetical protein